MRPGIEARSADWPGTAHALGNEEALRRLESTREGLTGDDAAARLRSSGRNELEARPPISAARVLLDQLRSTVVVLLVVATIAALTLGDHVESAAIGAVLLINTALGFVMEFRARRAMEALLRLETPRATVLRDGALREIDARDIVPGDVLHLEAGQSIAADARVLHATELRCNEATLTGESGAVLKAPDPVDAGAPLAERASMVYKGTSVATGTGLAVVVATGMRTELGKVGTLVASVRDERTPLEIRLDALGQRLAAVALAAGGIVAALGAWRGLPGRQMVETGLALAIAAVPEGLPAVATIAMAVGVHRMARRHAIVRRLPSVETLGSVTVVCADKTGTLTAGEMAVVAYAFPDREVAVTGEGFAPVGSFTVDGQPVDAANDARLAEALRIGALVNTAGIANEGGRWIARGDPTEAALLVAARKAGLDRDELRERWPRAGMLPFSSERMLMARFHRESDGMGAMVKGAPARVIERCASVMTADGPRPLDGAARERLLRMNQDLASRGLRVLALASGHTRDASEAALEGLTFVALAGTLDPPAEGVRETITRLHGAGVRTVMITGDQQLTARSIAADLGVLDASQEVYDRTQRSDSLEAALASRTRRIAAFSRVTPEDKLSIVSAYQRDGEIVAMLGDGVNDAPALRKADVGVAMGTRGTDVAKEAADIVLRDDRFRTIAAAVEEGRTIFDNIRKFVFYLFSCNLAEVGVMFAAGIAGLPMPLHPLQILWLNLVTDTFPALALAVDPADPGVMSRPPRSPQEAILSRRFMVSVAFFAAVLTSVTIAAFVLGLGDARVPSPRAMTMSFMTLALAQAAHLANTRARPLSRHALLDNRFAMGAIGLVVALQLAALYAPPIAGLLGVAPLAARDWAIVLGLSVVPVVVGHAVRRRLPM